MQFSFLSHFSSISIALVLFGLMVIVHWLGARLSAHPRSKRLVDRFGPIEGSLLGLLALLLAFTFSMSASRFDARRQELLERRIERQQRFNAGELPDFPAETRALREAEWTVAPIPADLESRGRRQPGDGPHARLVGRAGHRADVALGRHRLEPTRAQSDP